MSLSAGRAASTVKKAAKAAEKAAAKAAKGPTTQKRERGEPKKDKEVKPKEVEEEVYVNTTPKGDKKGASGVPFCRARGWGGGGP